MNPDDPAGKLDAFPRLRALIEEGLASGPGRADRPEDWAKPERLAAGTGWMAVACPTCGRLHAPMLEQQARLEAAACPGDSFEEYLRCGGCGTQSSEFVGVTQEYIERRPGVTHVLFACVVPGLPAADWDERFNNPAVVPPTFLVDRSSALDEDEADSMPAATFTTEGEVWEVLDGHGLAHVRSSDGSTYGLNRETPGIAFADLREGQRVRVEVERKFNRVLHAQLVTTAA